MHLYRCKHSKQRPSASSTFMMLFSPIVDGIYSQSQAGVLIARSSHPSLQLPPMMRPRRLLSFQILRQNFRPFSTPQPRQLPHQPPRPKDARSRLRALNDRLPRFLRGYTTPLLEAPVAHATSFLILHELTAIVPLFALVAAFHYGDWMPDFGSGASGGVFNDAVVRFGRWLRRKGWVDDDADYGGSAGCSDKAAPGRSIHGNAQSGRLVLEFASAYVVTKALLPVRIAASVWATPWFASTVLAPASKGLRGLLRR